MANNVKDTDKPVTSIRFYNLIEDDIIPKMRHFVNKELLSLPAEIKNKMHCVYTFDVAEFPRVQAITFLDKQEETTVYNMDSDPYKLRILDTGGNIHLLEISSKFYMTFFNMMLASKWAEMHLVDQWGQS